MATSYPTINMVFANLANQNPQIIALKLINGTNINKKTRGAKAKQGTGLYSIRFLLLKTAFI
jgi:hypothetical protein